MKNKIKLEIEYFETSSGDEYECITIENLYGIIDKIKKKYPNDADLGEYIRNN